MVSIWFLMFSRRLILFLYFPDSIYTHTKPSRQNSPSQVVYELWWRRKTKTDRGSARSCYCARRQAHQLCGGNAPLRCGLFGTLTNQFHFTFSHSFVLQFRNFKIVYRRYAGLYFCICVDVNDNNLCYLEAIHNFVEVLNEYFHNVCELDLVFNFYKVYSVVDEMFLAGEIRETSQTKVLKQLLTLNSLE